MKSIPSYRRTLPGRRLPRLIRHSWPEAERGEVEAGEVVGGEAVVTGGDAAELLELSDGALDAVAQLVEDGVEGARPGHAGSLRDDRLGPARLDGVEDGVGVVCLVGDDVSGGQAVDQRQRLGGVTALAGGEDEAYRPALTVNGDVPFAGQASSGAPQSLVRAPPF